MSNSRHRRLAAVVGLLTTLILLGLLSKGVRYALPELESWDSPIVFVLYVAVWATAILLGIAAAYLCMRPHWISAVVLGMLTCFVSACMLGVVAQLVVPGMDPVCEEPVSPLVGLSVWSAAAMLGLLEGYLHLRRIRRSREGQEGKEAVVAEGKSAGG